MRVTYHRKFLKSVKKLPKNQQNRLANLVDILRQDPYDPQLHTKHLVGELKGFLSFRVGREWRVLFRLLDSETIQLQRAAHRKDIYR